MSIEDEIKQLVESKKSSIKNNSVANDLLIEAGATLLAILPVALPVSLSLMAGGFICNAVSENKNLNTTSMPDEWLVKVSESKQVSKKGLGYLAKKVEKKGFVSVKEAIEFLDIEKKHEARLNAENKVVLPEGVKKILERDKSNSLTNKLLENGKETFSSVQSNVTKASQQSKELSDMVLNKLNPFKK